MRKLLILSLLPFAALCACDKGATSNKTRVEEAYFSHNQNTAKAGNKTLKFLEYQDATFGGYDDSFYVRIDAYQSGIMLNYKVSDIQSIEITFTQYVSMIKVTTLQVGFAYSKSGQDITFDYTAGGPIVQGDNLRLAVINDINLQDHVTKDCYMFIIFSGASEQGKYTDIENITLNNLTVTTK